MAKILIINKHKSGMLREKTPRRSEETARTRTGTGSSEKGSIKIGLAGAGFLIIFFLIFSSAFYLFQVNDLAVKGYDIRDLENKISELEKDNKQMQIHEMELRSMYVIEKSAGDFNLVSPVNVSYLGINNTVAIR
jgi:cell division protein FtsL